MNKRNYALEAFRVIFIIYMVIHHFDAYFSDQIPHFTQTLKLLFKEGRIGVNFFFMLSGFGCVMGYRNRLISGEVTLLQFLKNRIINLWPTYILFMITSIFLYKISSFSMHFFEHLFMLQAISLNGKYVFWYNGAAWCISACMIFYIMFCFIYKMNFKKSLLVAGLIFVFILINMLSYGSEACTASGLFYINPIFRSLEFIVGMAIALYVQEHGPIKSIKIQVLSILIIIIAIIVGAYSGIPIHWRWSLYYLLPCAFLIFSFTGETKFSKMLFNHNWLQEIAKVSMIIYLAHQELINALKFYLPENLKLLYFKYFIPFGAVGVIVLCVIIAFIVNKIYTKPITKFLKNVFNRKSELSEIVVGVERK